MLGRNIQQQFYLPTRTERMSSSNMVDTLLGDSSPTLTPCSTLNMTLPPKSSSMDTRISPLLTLMSYLPSLSKSSYHKANGEDPGEMIRALPALVRVPDEERTKGNVPAVHQSTPSVMISTNPLGASGQTAASSINALDVHQVATPSVAALRNRKRKCMSKTCEFEIRGKRPRYMHFIFGKGDIEHTPSATYTESAPAVPHIPPSDF